MACPLALWLVDPASQHLRRIHLDRFAAPAQPGGPDHRTDTRQSFSAALQVALRFANHPEPNSHNANATDNWHSLEAEALPSQFRSSKLQCNGRDPWLHRQGTTDTS